MADKKPSGDDTGQKAKKQIPLRLSTSLYNALAAWA
jgi:hypothetical protein